MVIDIEVAVTAVIGVGLAIGLVSSSLGLYSIHEQTVSQPSPLALAVIIFLYY